MLEGLEVGGEDAGGLGMVHFGGSGCVWWLVCWDAYVWLWLWSCEGGVEKTRRGARGHVTRTNLSTSASMWAFSLYVPQRQDPVHSDNTPRRHRKMSDTAHRSVPVGARLPYLGSSVAPTCLTREAHDDVPLPFAGSIEQTWNRNTGL